MNNSSKIFKAAVYRKKSTLPKAAEMADLWQSLLEQLKENFLPDETLLYAMPMTNSNSHLATSGIMGLSYAKKTTASHYVKDFSSLRGNRALLFTNQRILFVVVLDFLESGEYYTYPYPSIKNIYFKRHKISSMTPQVADIRVIDIAKTGGDYYYYLDFESDNHYFTDIFSPRDAEKLFDIFSAIPELKDKVNAEPGIFRAHGLDRAVSNPLLWRKKIGKIGIAIPVVAVIVVIKLLFDLF